MLRKTRCKFYVSSINAGSNPPVPEQQPHIWATVHLNASYSPDPNTENYAFWSATPVGNAILKVMGEQVKTYEVGTFWYIDIWEDENGAWETAKYEEFEYNINVELIGEPNSKFPWAERSKVSFGITNKSAWEIFGEGKRYSVEFIPAVKC